ncbi:phage tail protein [Halocynthiibacter namhaensis]|uniref:phage tail protein n=1 Tax=Halocynthiibacter namhaensis TaxID=1290553 RepID=UPI000578EAFD|nr:phage tail protein [Halocynthiibacter namhaensis]
MADLVEIAEFTPGIFQVETSTAVMGGPPNLATKTGGPNIAAQQLANRTLYNKQEIEALKLALGNIDVSAQINAAIAALVNGAPGALDTLNELAAAIGDNESELAALLAQIAALSTKVDGAGVPIGQVSGFHSSVAPAGWVVCDGSAVTALYPDLRTHLLAQPGVVTDVIGNPLLPDYRGEFMRGLDAGRGVDTGRVLGSAQSWAIENIVGTFDGNVNDNNSIKTGTFYVQSTSVTGSGSDGVAGGGSVGFDASRTVQTSNETRPRNIAALFCMKAADQALTGGMADLAQLLTSVATQAEAEAGVDDTKVMTALKVAQALTNAGFALSEHVFGVGQTRTDVTGLRPANLSIHNNTPKMRHILFEANSNTTLSTSVDGVVWVSHPLVNAYDQGSFFVMPWEHYKVNKTTSTFWEIS